MEIIKITKKNKNQYVVKLSDNSSLSFYDDTIVHYNLLGKKRIDQNLLKEISEYNQNLEAYYKALKDITVKLRTEKELVSRLAKNNYSKKSIALAIEKLKKQGYINDDLYLKSYVNDQVNLTLKGPRKITMELKKLGFLELDAEAVLKRFKEDVWQDKIKKVIQKKEKANHNLSLMMFKQKVKKDLFNLGFNNEMIEKQLNEYEFAENDLALEKEFNKEYKRLSKKLNDDLLKNKIKYNLYRKGFEMAKIEDVLNKYFMV